MTKFADVSCCFENFMVLDVPPEPAEPTVASKLYRESQLRIPTLNHISMPPIETGDADRFERIVADWQQDAEDYGKGAIPQLEIKEDEDVFRRKLETLCELAESEVVTIVNLRYADPEHYPIQYAALWESRDANLIFNCLNVPRKGTEVAPGIRETPVLELQRWGIDTITPMTRTPSPKYIAMIRLRAPLDRVEELNFDWSYHPASSVLACNLWKDLPSHSVECQCKVCKRKDQDAILHTYCFNDEGEIDRQAMRYASNLHDAISSELEYRKIRNFIGSNEMAIYQDEVEDYRNTHLQL